MHASLTHRHLCRHVSSPTQAHVQALLKKVVGGAVGPATRTACYSNPGGRDHSLGQNSVGTKPFSLRLLTSELLQSSFRPSHCLGSTVWTRMHYCCVLNTRWVFLQTLTTDCTLASPPTTTADLIHLTSLCSWRQMSNPSEFSMPAAPLPGLHCHLMAVSGTSVYAASPG